MRPLAPSFDRKSVVRLLGTAASLVLLLYLLGQQEWGAILEAVRGISTVTLAAVLALLVVSRLAVSARWYMLLRVADPTFPFTESLRLTLAGLFAANFLPTTIGGDVVRAAGVLALSRNRVGATASIVLDRLVGMAGMMVILPVGLARLGAWLGVSAIPSMTGGTWLVVGGGSMEPAPRWRKAWSWLQRVVRRLGETWRLWVGRPTSIVGALGFTWIHMLCVFMEIWLLLRAMGGGPSVLTIGGLWSLAYFITLIPISINGLGLREVSITYIFSELGAIPMETALTLALILRTLDILITLPGALLIPTIRTAPESPKGRGP
ncbi:MAG TPA: lysylphosphatidylglycerol synthase transmembrane domain-containing protein [Anaerolineales bacterium]|nr:lysylphosphatidylglycerol synthase transmembrane domain-containing protein [Anaerolineales bacterium]